SGQGAKPVHARNGRSRRGDPGAKLPRAEPPGGDLDPIRDGHVARQIEQAHREWSSQLYRLQHLHLMHYELSNAPKSSRRTSTGPAVEKGSKSDAMRSTRATYGTEI